MASGTRRPQASEPEIVLDMALDAQQRGIAQRHDRIGRPPSLEELSGPNASRVATCGGAAGLQTGTLQTGTLEIGTLEIGHGANLRGRCFSVASEIASANCHPFHDL